MKKITENYIDNFFTTHDNFEGLKEPVIKAIEILTTCTQKNKILVCGNGGSASDSEHIAGELLKSFVLKRQAPDSLREKLCKLYGEEGTFIADNIQMGIKCIPLTSFNAFNTAFSNDCDGQMTFAQLVNALGEKDDVLIAISTSGSSKNVVYASKMAKALGLKVIALTGKTGGKLKDIADVTLNVNSNITYKIQEMHLPIYHLLCLCLESENFEI